MFDDAQVALTVPVQLIPAQSQRFAAGIDGVGVVAVALGHLRDTDNALEVAVGVTCGVFVDVAVGVFVGSGVLVLVGIGVNEPCTTTVFVDVAVAVLVLVAVLVAVFVAVAVLVAVLVAVAVLVGALPSRYWSACW